jgi:nitrogen fixation/metabolism regulation signal transduction histidine kinase
MVMEQTLQDAAPSHADRRKIGNFFLKPAYNLKFGYRLIMAGFLCFGATAWLVWQKLGQFDALMNQNYADVSPVAAAEIMAQAAEITLGGFLCFVLFASMYALLMCHRVGGPMVAIMDTIQQLQRGNYDINRRLRKRDELHPIQNSLIELAKKLKAEQEDDHA